MLITAIGMSYLLQNLALLIWGSAPKSFTSVVSIEPLRLFGGGSSSSRARHWSLLLHPQSSWWRSRCLVNKTKVGHAMQAVSEDKGAAQLMGINVNATISLTFAIGSALAAVAGVLLCSAYPTLMPTTGAMPGIKAFVAAVFGGIGSIPGAMRAAGHHREPEQKRIFRPPDGGRHRVQRAHHRTACPPCGYTGASRRERKCRWAQ